jgi:hypothetical protein
MITLRADLRSYPEALELNSFQVNTVDVLLRAFLAGAQTVWSAAIIPSPALPGIQIFTPIKLAARVSAYPSYVLEGTIERGSYPFPLTQIDNLFDATEKTIHPVCDVVHEMFHEKGSPCFDQDSKWIEPEA